MEITISDSYELSDLAARWNELESRAAGGFFLSWSWIGTWLRTTGVRPLLVTATSENTTVALALLTPFRRRRHLIRVDQLCLHETGLAEFDCLTIEHNNFLVARMAPSGLIVEILRALQSSNIRWDEIVLGGVPPGLVSAARAAGLQIETDRSSPNFGVELDASPEGYVCSGSLKGVPTEGDVRKAALGDRGVRKLFSKEQQELYAEHAPEGVGLADLTILGPLFVLKLKSSPEGFDGRLVTEMWLYPDGSRILELSTKCEPSRAFDHAAGIRAYLASRGIDLGSEQQTKTRTALEFFSKQLEDGSASA